MEVKVKDKTFQVIKKYPNFTLCENDKGTKVCFDDFDLGLIKKRYIVDFDINNNRWEKHEQK